ncbi:MAG: Holliday junction branch migration DNA helicase RuvB [bacterium]|nr:Holliday junction branch migration DNA helicase RuvB [Acidimicrobiia bacterium]MCY4649725.1 Holliday junction branch migration DNA helicase RuvB [bacterium]
MREERVVAQEPARGENELETSLRPQVLGEFIGQPLLQERLRISIEAAAKMGSPMGHVLFSGPPGLGKTSMAGVIANELGVRMRRTSGPALDRPGDLASILSGLEKGEVFFVDELHRLSRMVEEVLYPAMEDYQLDIVVGKGVGATTYRLNLEPFTLVGATTRLGMISSPLRDRFQIIERFDYYTSEELLEIVIRSAGILGVGITATGAETIATRSRGTARVANRLLARVRDYAIARADGKVTARVANQALSLLEVDELGLDKVDRAILESVVRKFGGGPVGLSTLAIVVGEEPETVEEAYEPFLLQAGLLQRTPRGRMATEGTYLHLGLAPPADPQLRLV